MIMLEEYGYCVEYRPRGLREFLRLPILSWQNICRWYFNKGLALQTWKLRILVLQHAEKTGLAPNGCHIIWLHQRVIELYLGDVSGSQISYNIRWERTGRLTQKLQWLDIFPKSICASPYIDLVLELGQIHELPALLLSKSYSRASLETIVSVSLASDQPCACEIFRLNPPKFMAFRKTWQMSRK